MCRKHLSVRWLLGVVGRLGTPVGIRRGGPPPTDLGLEGVEDLFVFHMLNVDGSLFSYSMVPTIKNFG